MNNLKESIKTDLENANFEGIASLALQEKRVFSILISLSYEKTELICWRAIEAMGKAAGALTKKDPNFVRTIVQRLLWSLSEESGGVGWSAPDMLGEIVINVPDEFSDIPPIILSFKDEESFLPGVLWAMGRMASSGKIKLDLPLCRDIIINALNNQSPTIRGLSLWAASALKMKDLSDKVLPLLTDNNKFLFYEDHELKEISVKDMVRRLLKNEDKEEI